MSNNSKNVGFFLSFIALLGASLCLLASGLYIGLFNDLAYDDFTRAVDSGVSYWRGVKNWYGYHNGRFVNAFLADSSLLYQRGVYQYLHFVSIGLWLLSLYWLIAAYLKLFQYQYKSTVTIIVVAALFLGITGNSPNLGEWWFWYASASVYMIGGAFLFFGFAAYLTALRTNSLFSWGFAGVSLFLACGSHEVLSIVSLTVCGSLAVVFCLHGRRFFTLIPLLFVLFGASLLVFSPGTESRLSIVTGNGLLEQLILQLNALLMGLVPTILSGLKYWMRDLVWLFIVIISFLVGLSDTSKQSSAAFGQRLLLVGVVSGLVLLAIGALPVAMNWRININDPTRLTSLVYCVFLTMLFVNFYNLGSFLAARFVGVSFGDRITRLSQPLVFVASVGLIVAVVGTSNMRILYDDLRLNKPVRQAQSIAVWDKYIREAVANNESQVFVPAMMPVNTLVVHRYGPTIDPNVKFNKNWARYLQMPNSMGFVVKPFDEILDHYISEKYKPRVGLYSLDHFNDAYRNYLLVQIEARTRNASPICISLEGSGSSNINKIIFDESFARLGFSWQESQLCTDFVSRKVYCGQYAADWVCRIPLPQRFSGSVSVKWGDVIKQVSID